MRRPIFLILSIILFSATELVAQPQTQTPDFPNQAVPGRIEAEHWFNKSGYQYSATTGGTTPIIYMVGISNGSWMDYDVNVTADGTYTLNLSVATTQMNAVFKFSSSNDYSTILASISIPNSGQWDYWSTVTVSVTLAAGHQKLRFLSTDNETCNFDYFELVTGGTNQPPNLPPTNVSAGSDQTITLPTSQVTLTGTGSDPENLPLTYLWAYLSGTTGGTITSPSSASTTVTGLTQGTTIYRFTVKDEHQQAVTSDVTVVVNPATSSGTLPISGGGTGQSSFAAGYINSNGTALSSVATIPGSVISGNIAGNANNVTSTIAISNGGTNATTALAALNNLLPSQAGYDGRILSTNGTNASWIPAPSGGTGSQWNTTTSNNIYYNAGKVAIGATTDFTSDYKLFVEGNIRSRKIKVDQAVWSDYVFEKKYHLPTLEEVEKYIQQHKHLPDLPSAAEVEKNGIDLGDNQAVLLKKIEELTLYIIEQNKKIDELEKQNSEVKEMKKQLRELKKLILKN